MAKNEKGAHSKPDEKTNLTVPLSSSPLFRRRNFESSQILLQRLRDENSIRRRAKLENAYRKNFDGPPQNSTEQQNPFKNPTIQSSTKPPAYRYRTIIEDSDGEERNYDPSCTSFSNFNPAEFRERYAKQLKKLREALRDMRNHRYCPIKEPGIIKNVDKYTDDGDESDTDYETDVSDEDPSSFEEKPFRNMEDKNAHCAPVNNVTNKLEDSDGTPYSWPIRVSLFPHIPPYIKFNSHDKTRNILPDIGRRDLKWMVSTEMPVIIRKTLANTGFHFVQNEFMTESGEWMGTWARRVKTQVFKTLKNYQKVNHFVGTYQIDRKDCLWKNLQRLMSRYGTEEFGIIPETYILPQDLQALKQNWWGNGGEKWIIKPPAMARGLGIKVIKKWVHLPKQTSLVVQRYIADPFLINGNKFDLRLYVLVTSFDPLRIYIYPEGLVRFSTVKYSDDDNDLQDQYMHLTNCCINRHSNKYKVNEDANSCEGHEWTLSKLWEYMDHRGDNTKALWAELKRLAIKTMISGEPPIVQWCTQNMQSRYNSYELFGFDVLLDRRLKPWLLEVNNAPSIQTDMPVDLHIKGPLVQTLFNIAQFHFPSKLSEYPDTPPTYDSRLYTKTLLGVETEKHDYYVKMKNREDYLDDILDRLTGDDVRILTQAEDELVAKGHFERIFPTSKTYRYLDFMPARYYNRLCDAWECKYENNRQAGINRLKSLCAEKLHLEVASPTISRKHSPNMRRTSFSKKRPQSSKGERRSRSRPRWRP